MAVSKQDRDDYEQGRSDEKNWGVLERVGRDIIGDHPGSDAYYKGRSGRQLDDDKKSD